MNTMSTTKSIRLSAWHLSIVENISERFGMSFTDCIRHLVDQYQQEQADNGNLQKSLQAIERKIEALQSQTPDTDTSENVAPLNTWEILEDLQQIKTDMGLIKQVLIVIGQSDPRTKATLAKLIG